MVGSVLFAWWRSANFGFEPKKWRMFADVINDIGLTIELISPYYPEHFLLLICIGSMCRALCGVSAGASRAALMNHFARASNVADITAKEGIQETFVTLIGLVLGLWCTYQLDGAVTQTWILFVVLTLLHVYANYKGLSALVLTTLNAQRLSILINEFQLGGSDVLSPADVARREQIFWFGDTWGGLSDWLQWLNPNRWRSAFTRTSVKSKPTIRLGVAFHDVVRTESQFRDLLAAAKSRPHHYLLCAVPARASRSPTHTNDQPKSKYPNSLCVIWNVNHNSRDVLAALFHAYQIRNQIQPFVRSAAAAAPSAPIPAVTRTITKRPAANHSQGSSAGSGSSGGSGSGAGGSNTSDSAPPLSSDAFEAFESGLRLRGWELDPILIDAGAWRADWDGITLSHSE